MVEIDGIEYAVIGGNGRLKSHGPRLTDFLITTNGENLGERNLVDLIPELFGYDDFLELVRSGKQEQLQIERIFRGQLRGRSGYRIIPLISYDDGLLLVVIDVPRADGWSGVLRSSAMISL